MLRASIEGDHLNRIVNTANSLLEECIIKFRDGQIVVNGADEANIGLVNIVVDSECFESYETEGMDIGVNIDELADILEVADQDSRIEIGYDGKMNIKFGEFEYKFTGIDIDSIRSRPLPDIDLPAHIVVSTESLSRAISAGKILADKVALTIAGGSEEFIVHAKGDTNEIIYQIESEDIIEMGSESASSQFPIQYLDSIKPVLPDGGEIQLNTEHERPLKISYDILNSTGRIEFLLAPRIDNR